MKDVSNAVAYALLLPDLMKAGREVGYAIAVHGSLALAVIVFPVAWDRFGFWPGLAITVALWAIRPRDES